jgi:hypothetical protein
MRVAIGLLLALLAGTAHAQGAGEYGTLDACTTAGPCAPTRVFHLQEKTVEIDHVSGTLNVALECQLAPGGRWVVQQSSISADAVVDFTRRCHQIRLNVTTCNSPCVYSATFNGYRARK